MTKLYFVAFIILTIHFLVYLSFIVFYKTVGSFHYSLCRAIILFQFKQLSIFIYLLKTKYIINICSTESIDTLSIVTYCTHTLIFLSEQQQNLLLGIVSILILVNKHILKIRCVFLSHIFML